MARTCILRFLVCRCYDVFFWFYVCFVLLRFRLYAFVEAAALRSIVLRYADAPIATRVFFLFFLLYFRIYRFFRVLFVPLPFYLCMESTSYVLSSRMAFFYLVTTGCFFFGISLCEISINSINQSILYLYISGGKRDKICNVKIDHYNEWLTRYTIISAELGSR